MTPQTLVQHNLWTPEKDLYGERFTHFRGLFIPAYQLHTCDIAAWNSDMLSIKPARSLTLNIKKQENNFEEPCALKEHIMSHKAEFSKTLKRRPKPKKDFYSAYL